MPTPAKMANAAAAKSTARTSDSAPAKMPPGADGDLPVRKAKATNVLAASMPTADHKLAENGYDYALSPFKGSHVEAPSPLVGARPLAERNESDKVATSASDLDTFWDFASLCPENWSFDFLDATKLVPEELVPVHIVGRMVLNRNPDNFVAETEQVAFCVVHVVPGIDFTNDPLLASRIHSYIDTQISRLGGPNCHEIPLNAPIAPISNNQRDGAHRQAIHRGRVTFEPNSLAGGCPFQAGAATLFVSFPQPVLEDKVRGNPEKFSDRYTQATLFYKSQTDWEQAHVVDGCRFELSKLTVPAIRERMVAGLRNASEDLAIRVAQGLDIDPLPEPLPKALQEPARPEIALSPAPSLTARSGDGSVRTRHIALA